MLSIFSLENNTQLLSASNDQNTFQGQETKIILTTLLAIKRSRRPLDYVQHSKTTYTLTERNHVYSTSFHLVRNTYRSRPNTYGNQHTLDSLHAILDQELLVRCTGRVSANRIQHTLIFGVSLQREHNIGETSVTGNARRVIATKISQTTLP